jgi:pimeloyl-ACP methyl ester carboxylesterase
VAASRYRWLKAVVAYAPASAVFAGITPRNIRESSWIFDGKSLPFANGSVPSALTQKIEGEFEHHLPVSFAPEYLARLNGATPAARIPVEQIRGPVLVIAGGDDKLWPSPVMARQIINRLREHRHPYADRILLYPNAGHSIDYPFGPSGFTVAAGILLLGGTPEANAHADIDSWPQTIAFLHSALSKQH